MAKASIKVKTTKTTTKTKESKRGGKTRVRKG